MPPELHGVLIVDKPASWTSHDVVAKVRGLLHEKRIGHLGTLDPLATGVLPLAVGAATRLIEFASFDKEYLATCLLGRTTDSCDITGKVLSEKPVEGIDPGRIRREAERLKDLREQVPPMVSAVKSGGRKLYELARKGIEVERKPRPVEIKEVEVKAVEGPRAVLRVVCSAGTYVRVLCQTLGEALGVGGCMEALQRTRVGPFPLKDALGLEPLRKKVEEGGLAGILLASSRLVAHLPRIELEAGSIESLCHGKALERDGDPKGLSAVFNGEGRLCAIAESAGGNGLRPRKVFGAEGLP
jgi:tRNA pseudouridine55 synthase